MKKENATKKWIVIVVMMLGMVMTGYAQITIQSFDSQVTIGETWTDYALVSTLDPFDIEMGEQGGPHTWTFSSEDYPDGHSIQYSLISVPDEFKDSFPDAGFTKESVINDEFQLYEFMSLDNSKYDLHGWVGEEWSLNFTPRTFCQFPLQYEDTWMNEYEQEMELGGGMMMSTRDSVVATVDAFGSITTPEGTYNCLRIRYDGYLHNKTLDPQGNVMFTTIIPYTEFQWVTKELGFTAFVSTFPAECAMGQGYVVRFRSDESIGIEAVEHAQSPKQFRLLQNYPNPFNPVTTIAYELPQTAHVTMVICDITGRKVAELVNQVQPAGVHQVNWDARDQASGIYFCTLRTADGLSHTLKLNLLK